MNKIKKGLKSRRLIKASTKYVRIDERTVIIVNKNIPDSQAKSDYLEKLESSKPYYFLENYVKEKKS